MLMAFTCSVWAQNAIVVESYNVLPNQMITYHLSGPPLKGNNPVYAGNFLTGKNAAGNSEWVIQDIKVENGRYYFDITTYDMDIEMYYAAYKKNGKFGDNYPVMKKMLGTATSPGYYFLKNPDLPREGGLLKFTLAGGKIYTKGTYQFKPIGKYGDAFIQWSFPDPDTIRFFGRISKIPNGSPSYGFTSNLLNWNISPIVPVQSSGWAAMDVSLSDIKAYVEDYGKKGFMIKVSFFGIPLGAKKFEEYSYPNFTESEFWNPNLSKENLILYDRDPNIPNKVQ